MTYHLAGDSTVADAVPAEHPMTGWGGELPRFADAPVRNLAYGGATTASFLESGTWQRLLDDVAPGDTVTLQFGHNDQKDSRLAARGGYRDHLIRMGTDAASRGARVVLCTSCERRWFDGDRVTPTHGDYPHAVRDLAAERGWALIDLTAFTTWLYEDAGADASRRLLSHFTPGEAPAWPDGLADNTHFRIEGARRIAAFVATSLRAIERGAGETPAKGSPSVA